MIEFGSESSKGTRLDNEPEVIENLRNFHFHGSNESERSLQEIELEEQRLSPSTLGKSGNGDVVGLDDATMHGGGK